MIIISKEEKYLRKELIVQSVKLLLNEELILKTNGSIMPVIGEYISKVDINDKKIKLIYLKDLKSFNEDYVFYSSIMTIQSKTIIKNIYNIVKKIKNHFTKKTKDEIKYDLYEIGLWSGLKLNINNNKLNTFFYFILLGIESLRKNEKPVNKDHANNTMISGDFSAAKEKYNSYLEIFEKYNVLKNYIEYDEKTILSKIDSNPIVGYKKDGKDIFIKNIYHQFQSGYINDVFNRYVSDKYNYIPYYNSSYYTAMWPFINSCFLFTRDSIVDFYLNKAFKEKYNEIYNDFFFLENSINYFYENNIDKLINELSFISDNIKAGNLSKAIDKVDDIVEYISKADKNNALLIFDLFNLPTKTEIDYIRGEFDKWATHIDSINFELDKFFRGLYIYYSREIKNKKRKEIISEISKKFLPYKNSGYNSYPESTYRSDIQNFKNRLDL